MISASTCLTLISAFRRRLSLSLNFQKPTSRWCWILRNRQKNLAPSKSTVNRQIIGLNLSILSFRQESYAPAKQNKRAIHGGRQLAQSQSGVSLYAFVPDRARTAFPLFDQPNPKARYTLTLTMPADWEH